MTIRSGFHTPWSLLLASFLVIPAALAQKADPTPENINKGQAIYKKHCEMCHGAAGAGDGPAGRRLNPRPSNFQDKQKMDSANDEHLFDEITKGKGAMPAFERKLKENERWMVLHYVRTFAK